MMKQTHKAHPMTSYSLKKKLGVTESNIFEVKTLSINLWILIFLLDDYNAGSDSNEAVYEPASDKMKPFHWIIVLLFLHNTYWCLPYTLRKTNDR